MGAGVGHGDRPLAAGPTPLDPRAILAALGVAPAAVAPVVGGTDAAIWRVRAADRDYALRVLRAEQQAAHEREVAALAAARAGGVPVPTLAAVATWQGRPVQLQTWQAGATMLAVLQHQPWRAWPLGARFGRLHARIHAIKLPSAPWARPWILLAGPQERALQAALTAEATPEAALLHLDYHPLNVLCRGGRPSAVLDWTNATAGDARADFARTIALLRLAPDPPGTPRAATRTLRLLLEGAYRLGYRRGGAPQRAMPLFYAWAGAMTINDLAPKVGRSGFPVTAAHIAVMRRWTAAWKRRAGVRT